MKYITTIAVTLACGIIVGNFLPVKLIEYIHPSVRPVKGSVPTTLLVERYASQPLAQNPVTEKQENKFFEFMKTFSVQNDTGLPQILFSDPTNRFIVFSYPVNQKLLSYGVYDYENNTIYTEVGWNSPGGYNKPVAIIDDSKVLMERGDEKNKKGLDAIDFKSDRKILVKEILKQPEVTLLEHVYPNEDNSAIFIGLKKANSDNTAGKLYALITKTLELK